MSYYEVPSTGVFKINIILFSDSGYCIPKIGKDEQESGVNKLAKMKPRVSTVRYLKADTAIFFSGIDTERGFDSLL